jgi:hypothetical protein
MHLNKASVRLVVLAISVPLLLLGTIVSVNGQAPPNLPPPGAYVPIPNFTGIGAGALFRKAINDRFSGAQRMAPAIATASFANLPIEQDGTLIFAAIASSRRRVREPERGHGRLGHAVTGHARTERWRRT